MGGWERRGTRSCGLWPTSSERGSVANVDVRLTIANQSDGRRAYTPCCPEGRRHDSPTTSIVVDDGEAVVGQRRTQDVLAQGEPALLVVGGDPSSAVKIEPGNSRSSPSEGTWRGGDPSNSRNPVRIPDAAGDAQLPSVRAYAKPSAGPAAMSQARPLVVAWP